MFWYFYMDADIMKIGFIFVLYKTPEEEKQRLMLEIIDLNLPDYKVYFIDNTNSGKGYAEGVNDGIRRALIGNCQLLIVGNPDISLKDINKNELLDGGKKFDIWGLVMKQQGKIYYGGEIDPWRLTGGLIIQKPKTRFKNTDWVSGSLMFIKKKAVDSIGYFSEDYFMYYEDVDYCQRAKMAGLRVGIDSKLIYEHFEVSVDNPDKQKFLSNSKKLFFRKYSNIGQKLYKIGRIPKTILEKQRFWTSQNDTRKGFFINFASLNVSSLLNKLLNFLLFIFLIRYLSPNEYGLYTLVWAQVLLFSPIVDLGTTSYGIIDLPTENKNKFISLFNLRLLVSILVFFLTGLTGFIIFKDNTRIVVYVLLTSFVIFSNVFSGSYLIKNAVTGKLYNSSFVSIIFNLVLISSLIISISISGSLPVIFLLTFIFYNLYSFVNYFLIKKDITDLNFKFEFKTWINFLKKSYAYVLIGFLASLYFRLDIFLLQILKSEREVGIYSAGYKFFEGLMFIAASYNISRLPMLAKLVKKGKIFLFSEVKKDILLLAGLGFLISVITYFLAPYILPVLLKGNYKDSIIVVRTVMFALPFILISSVFLNTMYVLNKAKIVILVFSVQVIFNFVLNFIFIPKYSYIASSYVTVLSEIVNVVMLIVIYQFIIKKIKNENIT